MQKQTRPFNLYPSPEEHAKLLKAAQKKGKKLSRWALDRLLRGLK